MTLIKTPDLATWLVRKLCEPGHVTAITARQGSGKTNAMAWLAMYAAELDFEVITNIRFNTERPNIKSLTKYSEIFLHAAQSLRDKRPTLFAADEMTMFSNPRRAMSKEGKEFAEFITVIRHCNMAFMGTTLALEMADKVISQYSIYCLCEITPPKDRKKKGRWADFRLDEFTDAGYRRRYQMIIPPCPAYQSQRFGTDIIPDISITDLRRACTESPGDIPAAIEENVQAQLSGKDSPFIYCEKNKVKVGLWLKGRNPTLTWEQIGDMVGVKPGTLRAAECRRGDKSATAAPTAPDNRVMEVNQHET